MEFPTGELGAALKAIQEALGVKPPEKLTPVPPPAYPAGQTYDPAKMKPWLKPAAEAKPKEVPQWPGTPAPKPPAIAPGKGAVTAEQALANIKAALEGNNYQMAPPAPTKPPAPKPPSPPAVSDYDKPLDANDVSLVERKRMLAKALEEVNNPKPKPVAPPPEPPKPAAPQPYFNSLTGQPPTKPREILPEGERQQAREAGGYTTPAFRGLNIKPGKDIQGVYQGSNMYSTADPVLADMYSSYISNHPTKKASGPINPGTFDTGSGVAPLWIDTSQYLQADAKGAHWSEFNSKAIAKAHAAGKKGVIIDNVWDEPSSTHSLGEPKKIFITFDPTTVKSRFASHFDPKSKDMMRSIAGIGIGGAGGYVAMAAPEAKASEGQQWPGTPAGKAAGAAAPQWPGTKVDKPAESKPAAPPPAEPSAPSGLDPRSVKERLAGAAPPAMNAPGIMKAIAGYPGHLLSGVGDVAKRSFEASEQLRRGEGYDPSAPMEAALMTVGAGGAARGGLVPNPVKRPVVPGAAAPHPAPAGAAPPAGGGSPPGGPPGGATPATPPGAGPALTPAQAVKNSFGVIEKLLSPETVDQDARRAAGMIREATGTAERTTAQSSAAIESGWKKVNSLPAQDQLNFIDYVQGRSGQYTGLQMADAEMQGLADQLKSIFDQRMNKLQNMPKFNQMQFIQDYFPQMWKESGAASNVKPTQSGGGAKTGSGASMKKRSIPTYADGIAAGLTPVTTNPLEATMRYVASMDRFIGQQEIWETAKNQGDIKFIRPKVMGASGHPDSFKVPDGWAPLKGRGSVDASGAQAYAPEGFARVYNNWIDRGIGEKGPEYQQAYDAVRHASNAVTGLELSMSGYHFLTVSKAALDNSIAQAIQALRTGHPIQAAKQVLKTPLAPIGYARSGKQVKDVYLGLSKGSQHLDQIVDNLTKAGGRAGGKSHAPEYEFSKRGSFVTAIKRGALKLQYAADRANAVQGPAWSRPFREIQFAGKQIGRIMDTVAAPLFEQYIPSVKNGAFRENLSNWMQQHPNATQAEIENAARQTWDDIDDRFGEMVSENMFMGTLIKQIGQLALRSWSWTVGQDVRMLGGAARDIARAPFKKPTGTGPHDTRWTSKMDQAIAMPIVYGTLAAIYQFLKTGQPPQDVQDLMAPRTGGIDKTTRQPERLLMPGPEKDVFGFYEHGTGELGNKVGTVPGQATELWRNQDYRGDPHFSSAQNAPPWLTQIWEYAAKELGPISLRNLGKGQEKGSNLNRMEQLLGVRKAPRYLTDPEGYKKMMQGIGQNEERKKLQHQNKQRQLYEGD